MSYDQTKVAFVDIETTGLDPELDYVWEVAVIVDGVEHVWQQRLPGTDGEPARGGAHWSTFVSDWVLENTRIVDAYDHAAALDPVESIDRFCNLVDGRHLVGACPWFDSERLHRLILAHIVPIERLHPWHYHLIDVENLAVGYIHGVNAGVDGTGGTGGIGGMPVPGLPWKSVDLSRALGVDPADFEPKHSALADARWAKALYERMMGDPR